MPKKNKKPRKILDRIRFWFLTGILVSVPIILTFYIAIWIINFFDNIVVEPLIPEVFPKKIPGLGLLVTLLFMTIIGFIASNFLGRFFVNLSKAIINRIPVIRTIYSTLTQIFETVLSTDSRAFKDVVLIEYPKKDSWVIAFVTSPTKGLLAQSFPEEMVNVFVPTTPNPTSGFMLIIPKKEVIALDMKTDEAMRIIISGGMISEDKKKNKKSSKKDS